MIRRIASTTLAYAILAIALVLAVFPLLWTISTSFKTEIQANAYPPVLVGFHPTLANYRYLFASSSNFYQAAETSIAVTACTTVLAVMIAAPNAYALVRMRVPARRVLVLLLVLVETMPGIVLVTPLFFIVAALHLYDTWLALILVYTSQSIPFATWVLVAFIRGVPIEVEEAAFVDGATRLQTFAHVVLPLVAPGLATVAIFTAIGSWNQFLVPVILGENGAETLTVFVTQFVTEKTIAWGSLSAAVVLVMAPIVVFVIAAQRYLVKGLTMGSVK